VFYTGGHWAVFNEDGAAMPVNPAASAATAAIESAKTPDERQRNYLRMVRG